MNGKGMAALVLLPFALLFSAFQLAPLVWMAIGSFLSDLDGWGLANYRTIFSSPFYRQAMQFSLQLTFSSSLCGLLIATVASYSLHRLGANGCVTLLLRRYGWMTDFSLYSKTGLTVLYTYFQIPLGVLLLFPAFGALREEWRESAALLGASRLRYWLRIGLPVLTPALLGTFLILLANALGAYATLFALTTGNYNIIPIRISALVAGDLDLDPHLASALGMVLVALMVLITLVHQLLVRRSYIRTL